MNRARAAALSLLLTVAALPGAAAENAQQTETRIARVEAGLLPPILWKGEKRVGASLAERMATYQMPGVSVAVVDDFALVWARGWGVARAGGPGAVTPDTLFQAGSISKSVTALLTLRLVGRGRLGLDDPVNRRLESWKLDDSDAGGEQQVTIRHLLTHSGGLAPITYEALEPGAQIPSALDLLSGKGQQPPPEIVRIEPPGRRYSYSNPGYLILQQLLTDVSGKPFDELARTEMFVPLGMKNSSFAQVLPPSLLKRAAWGHGPRQQPMGSRGLVVPAAVGGLWTTPSDLARLLVAVLRSARDESGGFLPNTLAREAMTAQVGSQSLIADVEGSGPARLLVQMGAMPGFTACIVGYPELGRGAVIMVNAGGGSGGLIRELTRAIAVEYEWPGYVQEYERTTLPVATLASFVGQYELDRPAGFRIGVSLKDGRLLWADREMIAVVGGFFVVPSAGVRVEFVRDDDGAIVAADFGPPGARTNRARRVE